MSHAMPPATTACPSPCMSIWPSPTQTEANRQAPLTSRTGSHSPRMTEPTRSATPATASQPATCSRAVNFRTGTSLARLAEPRRPRLPGPSQGVVDVPAVFQAQKQGVVGDASLGRPLGDGQGPSAPFNSDVAAAVVLLDAPCRPAAVSGFVSVGVVDAVERIAGAGARSHVGQESRETGSPLGGHRDAARAVPVVRLMTGVTASGLGLRPRGVFRRHLSVGFRDAAARFVFSATATGSAPTTEIARWNAPFIAAIAQTQPSGLILDVLDSSLREQSSESLARKVVELSTAASCNACHPVIIPRKAAKCLVN